MTPDEFDALFDSFRSTAVRMEKLQAYDVGGAEALRIKAFRDGSPRPERSLRTDPWLRRIAVTTASGKSWTRVRVVDVPLTDYQRYQLAGYVESQAVGEHVRLAPRADVDDVGQDFWLFDASTDAGYAAVMQYDEAGRFEGADLVRDPAVLIDLEGRVAAVAAHSVPLNEFLAGALA